jgi:2-(1,2-epoxy-1,2-dihydrophenyl)acetyl-CoA isomerase
MSEVLLSTREAGVLTLTLNRPERLNALTMELNARLLTALTDAAADASVRAIVLTGAGRGFCSGRDVGSMADRPAREATMEGRAETLRERVEVTRLLHEMPKPTVAMVRGAAAGAGMSLALACDVRIASDTAKFAPSFARIGLSGDYGATYFLTKLIGPARAREFLFLSPTLLAEEALRLGLINRVVPDASLETEAKALATALASGPSVAYGYIKRNINAAEDGLPLAQCLTLESFHNARCTLTADHAEAVKAFAEKRNPVFTGN